MDPIIKWRMAESDVFLPKKKNRFFLYRNPLTLTFQLMRVLRQTGKPLFVGYRHPEESWDKVRTAVFGKWFEAWMPAFALITIFPTEIFWLKKSHAMDMRWVKFRSMRDDKDTGP